MESTTLTMDGNIRTIGHDGHARAMGLHEFVAKVSQSDLEEGGSISRPLEARYGLSPFLEKDGEPR